MPSWQGLGKKFTFTLLLTLAEHKHSEDSTQATGQMDLMQCSVWLWHSRTRLTKCPLYQNWVHQTLQCSGNRSRPITHTICWMFFGKTNDPNFASHTDKLCRCKMRQQTVSPNVKLKANLSGTDTSNIEIPPVSLSKIAWKPPKLVVGLHTNKFILCFMAEVQSKPAVTNSYHEWEV